MERLVLFDIDGTLVRTQNGYVPFNEAIFQSFGIAGDIRTVVPDGNTDPHIVEEIFAAAKVDISIADEHWERFATNLRLSYANAVRKGTTARRGKSTVKGCRINFSVLSCSVEASRQSR